MHGAERTFATEAADHANCSVGSYTHGFLTLAEAAAKDDVEAVLEAGWVDQAAVMGLPHVAERPGSVVYGPLAECGAAPDVVLLRINGFAMMTLKSACRRWRSKEAAVPHRGDGEGRGRGCGQRWLRPQPRAYRHAAGGDDLRHSGARIEEVVDRLEATVSLDRMMAHYAAVDAQRFDSQS